ncbi:hypothetical protein FKM82_013143 [Ascaphus truei]
MHCIRPGSPGFISTPNDVCPAALGNNRCPLGSSSSQFRCHLCVNDFLSLCSLLQFRREEDAERALKELNDRWFNGQAIHAELSPVTDFRESCCRQYEMGECTRGGFCNFMHLKPISSALRRQLYGRGRPRGGVPKPQSPKRFPDRHRPNDRGGDRGGDRGDRGGRRRSRSPRHRHGRF